MANHKRNQAIAMAYDIIQNGSTEEEIGDDYGVSATTVRRYLSLIAEFNEPLYLLVKRAQRFKSSIRLTQHVIRFGRTQKEIEEIMGKKAFDTALKNLLMYDMKTYILVRTRLYNLSRSE